MITNQSLIKFGCFSLLAFAIAATPTSSLAQATPTGSDTTTTNVVKTVKHKKKKAADTNAPAATVTAPATTTPATTPPPPAKVAPAATTAPVNKTTSTQTGHNKSGVLPFHGNLKAVDTAAMTISVGTRTFAITSETIIIKDGKPATLADGVVGVETGGAYKKTDDGKLVVTKLRFGAKSAAESTGTK